MIDRRNTDPGRSAQHVEDGIDMQIVGESLEQKRMRFSGLRHSAAATMVASTRAANASHDPMSAWTCQRSQPDDRRAAGLQVVGAFSVSSRRSSGSEPETGCRVECLQSLCGLFDAGIGAPAREFA